MNSRSPARAIVQRHIDAAPERVYDAWLDRALIGEWMLGPLVGDKEIVHLALTPRVGGRFSFHVERSGEDVEIQGQYQELERGRRLVFTWLIAGEPAGARVLVELSPERGGTGLKLVQEMHPEWTGRVAGTVAEWAHRLDLLELALAAKGSRSGSSR